MPKIILERIRGRMPLFFYRFCGVLVFVLAFFTALPGFAQESLHKRYQTRYAEIQYEREDDLHRFTANIGTGLRFWTSNPKKNPLLARNRVDSITDAVIKILEMRPVDLAFSIRLYRSRSDLGGLYRRMGMLGPVPPAFYSHHSRSISVSLDDVSARVLAHEIAHAVIIAYFGNPPPRRMQEILAQYVDEHLEE